MCTKGTSVISTVTVIQPTQIIGWQQNVNKLRYWKKVEFNQNHLHSFGTEEDTKVRNTIIGNEVTPTNLLDEVEI
ncbi:hypothetical protein WN50_36895 [Limnoraphis robusta CS-951]|jgi:hypothetical protein|uniref:Uncharacterized protein n=1 Tax=Limnoraphis robusta CS-951 TaxID=1637645 RepID=A0A0J9EVD2_9CYAN|nr:hypothetical protein WN50_36895 [Limnoraphis robusta CS-951]